MATLGSLGDLHPYLAVGLGLMKRGHDVTVATAELYRGHVTREGMTFHPMRPNFDAMASNPEMVRRAFDPHRGAEFYVRELVLPFIEQTHADLLSACKGADLLLIQPTLFTAPIVAEMLGLKWLSVFLAPGSLFSAYDPPLLPPVPWLHRLRGLGPWPQRTSFAAMKIFTRGWTRSVDEIRRRERAQYTSKCALYDDLLSPYGTLAWYSEVLGAKQVDWPDPSRVTGFPYYVPASTADSMSPALEEFLSSGDAPVVFTLGSSAVVDPGDFFQQSLDAIQRIGRRAVLLVGKQVSCAQLPSNPGIFIAEYAPYSELFPRCAAVVHQGGIGTLACALHAGVPSLIVPRGLDQPDNAFRARRIGVARVLPRWRYSGARAASHLRALLDSPQYSVSAQATADRIRRENGIENACDAIEEVLRQPKLDARN